MPVVVRVEGSDAQKTVGSTVAVLQQSVHARCCAWTGRRWFRQFRKRLEVPPMQLGMAVVPELRRWGFQGDFGPFFALRPHGR